VRDTQNADLPWKPPRRVYVAFAPADNPNAVAAVVEHGGGDQRRSSTRDVMLQAFVEGHPPLGSVFHPSERGQIAEQQRRLNDLICIIRSPGRETDEA
jgi:hypothetical protein